MAEPSVEEYQAFARPKVEAGRYDWETFRKQIQQESNWRHLDANGAVKTSYSGVAKGIGQLNKNFYGPEIWQDPWTNLSKGIELATGYLARFGSHRKALASFNWGPGNVGGYTENGRVHPAWDGTREWRCPHEAVVAQCRTTQRDHYLDVILGPGWPEPGGVVIDGGDSGVTFEDYRDPGHALFSAQPKGVVLHGSRSGATSNTTLQEYKGTANWELVNPNGYAWHATIGPSIVAIHLTAKEWGQHDPWASQQYMGVEFAQPTVNDAISDSQVTAFCAWFKKHVLPVWPNIPLHFPSHAEVDREYGQNQGKSDVFPLNDGRMDDLRARIMKGLAVQPQPKPGQPDTFSVTDGIRTKMAEAGDSPASDELYFKKGEVDEWSECMGASGSRYVYIVALNRTFRYPPAA